MGKSQINVQVGDCQKEDWVEYLDESRRFSSLSDLVRAAVEKEIKDEGSSQNFISPALESDVHEVAEDLARVRKDVRWLRQQHQDEADVSGLAQEVFDSLEPLPEPSGLVNSPEVVDDERAYRRQLAALSVIVPSSDEEESRPQTVSAIADKVDVPESEVRDALEHLKNQFLPVVEVEIEGEVHYFREA